MILHRVGVSTAVGFDQPFGLGGICVSLGILDLLRYARWNRLKRIKFNASKGNI
jgi:hypothetical protein